MTPLLYVGQQTADALADSVDDHLERYTKSGFDDLESTGDWRIPLSIRADLDELTALRPENGKEAEVYNSMLVGRALASLTPSLARENRIWIRLSHLEGLEYSRKRWLTGVPDAKLAQSVRTHFFAPTWTACRDDHAISRLWWNHQIASLLMPESPGEALDLILSRADIRLSFIERSRIGTRLPLARAIVNELKENDTLRSSELGFRRFMKRLNAEAAGQYIEIWDNRMIRNLIARCCDAALTTDSNQVAGPAARKDATQPSG